MEYKTTTATAAVLHFAEHCFRPAFKGKTGKDNPDYFRAVQIIKSAKSKIGVSDDRARWLLENYGGDTYRVESKFEVAIKNPCIHCGAESEEAVFHQPFDDPGIPGRTYPYPANVCTADKQHIFQTGEQMDRTPNAPTFAELAAQFREKHPNAFGLPEEEI